jgi:excisionase family DNA binding protein
MQDEILTIDQLSKYLRVPKSTLYRLVGVGAIPAHKIGRHWRFRRESVDRWMDEPRNPLVRREGAR